MSTVMAALQSGDELVRELASLAPGPPATQRAPTMGRLQKVRYTHADMIDFIIRFPEASQNEIAARYGYTPGWISNVLASDAFQAAMAARKEEIVDPELKATIEERMRALVIRSQQVLMSKLNQPQVSDAVALRSLELGARALAIGGNAPPTAPSQDRLVRLAERLVDLQSNVRQGVTYEGQRIRESEPEFREEGTGGGQLRDLQGPQPRVHESAEGAGTDQAD